MKTQNLKEKNYVQSSELFYPKWRKIVRVITIVLLILIVVLMWWTATDVISNHERIRQYTFSPSSETEYIPLGSFIIQYKKNGETFTEEIFCEYVAAEPEQTVYCVGIFKGTYAALKYQYSIRLKSGEREEHLKGIKIVINSEESKYIGEEYKFNTLPDDFGTEIFADNVVEEIYSDINGYTILEWKLN